VPFFSFRSSPLLRNPLTTLRVLSFAGSPAARGSEGSETFGRLLEIPIGYHPLAKHVLDSSQLRNHALGKSIGRICISAGCAQFMILPIVQKSRGGKNDGGVSGAAALCFSSRRRARSSALRRERLGPNGSKAILEGIHV
jgi:hypothetical protein